MRQTTKCARFTPLLRTNVDRSEVLGASLASNSQIVIMRERMQLPPVSLRTGRLLRIQKPDCGQDLETCAHQMIFALHRRRVCMDIPVQ
jgi:hypothetical protein